MDPAYFESTYHDISIDDPRMGLVGSIDLAGYVSGWPPPNMGEYMTVLSVIAGWLGLAGPNLVPGSIFIPNNPLIDPSEVFYKAALRRAYEGRASPEEFRDAVRLAFATRRFSYPTAAQTYVQQWFGIDCNTFVGNYCGISPSTSIAAYARGYPPGALSGATPDVLTSRDLLPAPPVGGLDDIGAGTIVATYGTPDSRGNRWRHIALVQEFNIEVGVGGARTGGWLSMAEWGGPGGSSQHVTTPAKVAVIEFDCPELPGRKCLAFAGTAPGGSAAMRIFLDGSTYDEFDVRGYQVYNGSGSPTWDT